MNGKEEKTPQELALFLHKNLSVKDEKEKAKAENEILAATTKLIQAAQDQHKRRFLKADANALIKYLKNLLGVIFTGNKEQRFAAANTFVTTYEFIVSLLKADAKSAAEIIKTIREHIEDTEEIIRICPGELSEPLPDSEPKHISIKKPGDSVELETVTLSPDFSKFLRVKHSKDQPLTQLLSKKSFIAWLDTETGKDWLKNNDIEKDKADLAELYRTELQKAFEDFEKASYQEAYSKPQNIPMPGIQYGHRLLRLPLNLRENNFIDSQIYEGPVGRINTPDVDLEELVRRYVNALYLTPITIYNFDDISPEFIDQYYLGLTDLVDPDRLAIFDNATNLAISSNLLLGYVREKQEQGMDLTPEDIAGWMLSEESSPLKNEIIDNWGDTLAEVLPGAVPGLLEELEDENRFRELIMGLCVPNLPLSGNGKVGPGFAGAAYISDAGSPIFQPPEHPWEIGELKAIKNEEKGPEDFTIIESKPGEKFATAVKTRIDDLTNIYDRAWRAVKSQLGEEGLLARKDYILYSGYEFKAIVSWLSLGALCNLAGSYFNGAWTKDGKHRNPTNIDAYKYLKDEVILNWHLLISERDIWEQLTERGTEVNDWIRDLYYVGENISLKLGNLVDKIIDSYRELIDTLMSMQPAARITGSITGELNTEQIDSLYAQWVDTFSEFLRHYSATRQIAKKKRMTVRLTPRTGKYEEVPKPTNESEDFKRDQILPSHPRMLTEMFMLEPIPDKYACNPYPTMYLREDLSLRVQHRGFGIGANLYSMSLLPEEIQKITIKSFKDTKIKESESTAENIFEETTDETAEDFAKEMKSESERESSSQSEFNISGKASASWGWGSASIESGYSSQSSSRGLAKNASNVSNRLATKLSAKRTVSVETKRTVDKEIEMHSGVETERDVKNPNKGHTLTFHWFQMTRKLATELRLEDLKLVYTSGWHKQICVFGNGKEPEHPKCEFRYLPDDIGRKLPPDTIIVVCSEPYTETTSMANANVFMTRIFNGSTAVEFAASLWQLIGSGDPSPDGYGIAAFCGPRQGEPEKKCKYISVIDPTVTADEPGDNLVPADEVFIKEDDKSIFLPNIDIRYKREDGLAPTRYPADEFDAYSLPRTLLREEQVINTNGVYCDAMIGQCSALEDYLQRHRDLDLLEKEIEVGGKELDFKWALAKDGMVEIQVGKDDSIVGLVREKEDNKGFERRLAIENAKRQEEEEIYEEKFEKQRKREELNLVKGQIAELVKKVEGLGEPTKYTFDVPDETKVNFNVNINPDKEKDSNAVSIDVK